MQSKSQTDEELGVGDKTGMGILYGTGVGYGVEVGWVSEKRYECSGISSKQNRAYEGLLER